MPRIEYSPGLEAALRRANALARGEAADLLLPRHVLQGIVAEEEGLSFRMLADHGVDMMPLLPGGLPMEEPEGVLLSTGPALAHVLYQARQAVPWHSPEGTLTSDLVLLALLERDEETRNWLIGHGLDWPRWNQEHPLQSPSLELDEPLNLQQSAAPMEVARLLDATANRAREALRVLEDYARFVLDDAFLTRELKTLRHRMVESLAPLSLTLLQARATMDDVGTSISTPQEQSRESVDAVVLANAKRLQEALRSLEEFGKVHSPELGSAIEQLRYRAYTLERVLTPGRQVRDRLAHARLYVLISEKGCRLSAIGTAREVLEGGADVIQVREKDADDRTLLEHARQLRRLTREHEALFIVNDRIDIARLCDADGVHLGQEDLSVRDARRILGPDALIGVSTHTLEQVRQAILEGASYIGVGPTFTSHTKDFSNLAGLEFVQTAHSETSLPAFVLGGITLENLESVLQAGAKRVAVSHAICADADPQQAARAFGAGFRTDRRDQGEMRDFTSPMTSESSR